jgi:hypothetical protein
VRERLHLERGKSISLAPTLVSHGLAVAAIAAAGWLGIVPRASSLAMAVLFARAVHGLSSRRVGRTPAAIGMQEIVFGLLVVLLTAYA